MPGDGVSAMFGRFQQGLAAPGAVLHWRERTDHDAQSITETQSMFDWMHYVLEYTAYVSFVFVLKYTYMFFFFLNQFMFLGYKLIFLLYALCMHLSTV